jgi:hypothetical protein
MRETRAHAIWRHVQLALRHTGATEADFAENVAALYLQRTPLHLRGIEFHAHVAGGDPYAVLRANAQLLFRMLKPDGPTRLPVELEEAVVLALPQPYQDEAQRDLAERLGRLAAPLPASSTASLREQVKSPCALMRSAADAVERIAPMLEDGHIGAEDAPHFADALASLSEVMGLCVTLNAQIAQAMQPAPRAGLRAVGK